MHNVFDYVLDKGGLYTEAQYPYIASEGESCRKPEGNQVKELLKDYRRFKVHNSTEFRDFLSYEGLVTVGIDIKDLLMYKEGVFDGTCGSNINHAVVIVGFGRNKRDGQKFWKIRNSWGSSWGESGYFKIGRHDFDGVEEICGITQYAVSPLGDEI